MNSRPNILFIVADDHRADALGCNGDATVQTPHLDTLAAAGANCTGAFMMGGLTGAVCVPARAMLHSGASTFRAVASQTVDDYHGLMTIRPDNVTLGQTLRSAGYRAHGIGKWHNDAASFNRSFESGAAIFMGGMHDQYRTPSQGYDPTGAYDKAVESDGTRHSTDIFCDAAVDFLGDYNGEQPFFLYVALTSPHDPRTAPEPFASMYAPGAMPLPPNFMPQHPFDNGELEVRDEQLATSPRTPAEIRRHSADYYAMISHQDARIGDILQALEARGLAENTIVIYTGDHGLSVGRHGLVGKQNLYEHSVRVPLLVRGPGVPQGEFPGLCYAFDLYPTLCEAAGAPIPATVEGRSLWPLWKGETGVHRPYVGAVYRDVQRMWRDDEWKLIRYFVGAKGEGCECVQLFHVASDPHELKDLAHAPSQRERVKRMLRALGAWQTEVADSLPIVEPS